MNKDNNDQVKTNTPEAAKPAEINANDYYEQAKQILEANSENVALYKKAQELLEQISGYKNSAKLLQECNDKILAINLKKDMAKRKKKKTIRNIVLAIVVIVVAVLAVSAVSTQNSADKVEYEKALQYLIDAEDPSLLGASKDKDRNKIYNKAYSILNNQGRTDEVFKSKLKRAMNLADDERYDAAFDYINKNVLNQDETIYTQAMTEAIDEAYAYIDGKILERANAKLEAKDYYGALNLYRYLDVTDEAIAASVKKCQTEPFKTSKTGDVIKFGTYEINCKTGDFDEDIEWIVLAKEGNKYLLVTKDVLDASAFNSAYVNVTWADSSIRAWLNGDFINKAFNAGELSSLNTTKVETDGKTTDDKVFLLSKAEVEKYLTADTKVALNTTYADTIKGVFEYVVEKEVNGKEVEISYSAAWWLRDTVNDTALTVDKDGKVGEYGHFVTKDNVGVRPAIWVTID